LCKEVHALGFNSRIVPRKSFLKEKHERNRLAFAKRCC
jgi:hypothetical protein